jgi:drug/metabolite transporter (DMT)-like permease
MGEPGVVAAMLVAFASTCGFALSTSLQHRTAGQAPDSVGSSLGVLRFVVTRPPWLLGIAIGAVAFVLHAIALKLGALAVVQPIMIAGVVLAVPVRTALDRQLPSRRELGSVLVTAIGLATFLVVANPVPSDDRPDRNAAFIGTLLCLLAAASITAFAGRVTSPRPRALLLGVSAGVLFGLVAALIKLVLHDLDDGPLTLFASWPLYALIGAGVSGTAINQRAYQVAPLSMSMPVLNIVDVLVAVGLGAWAFGEPPANDAVTLVVQGAALACMAVGLHQIARTHRTQSQESGAFA